MTASELVVRADDGGSIALTQQDDLLLQASPLLHAVIDRRRRQRLVEARVDAEDGRTVVSGLLEDTTVAVRWTATPIGGEPVWELALDLTNTGDAPVSVRRMDPLAARLGGPAWSTLAFRSAWGDEFRPERDRSDRDVRIETRAGRSSHGWSPWLGLERDGAGLVVAPAWSGNWHIDVTEGSTVTAGVSDWRLEVVLAGGESVAAPSVVLAAGSSRDEAARALTKATGRSWIPRSAASERLDVEWNHWWPYEDAEIDEATFRANSVIAGSIGIGFATLDAGWFGPADARSEWPRVRGDWASVNTARFPSGLGALGDAVRASGVRPGIWLEGEAVGADAVLRAIRPELLALAVDGTPHDRSYGVGTEALDPDDPTFLGYVCLGSPEGREFFAASLDEAVRALGAEWLKLDFNVDPDAGCTRTDHGHGSGDGLLRHVQGLYAELDAFRARHPEVVLEACSSGGLRLDLGLARHVHCLFLSDPDHTEHHLQVLWGASLLLPPAAILHWSWSEWRGDYPPARLDFGALTEDEFGATLKAAMLHRFGVSLRLPDLGPAHLATLRRHVAVYREVIAPLVRTGELLRLTSQPERGGAGERAPAFQLQGDGVALVARFRLSGAGTLAPLVPLGVDVAHRYRVTDPFTRASREVDGADLLGRGLPLDDRPGFLGAEMVIVETMQDAPGA